MRTNIDQIDHQPFVYIIETESTEMIMSRFAVPIEPAEKVFDLAKAKQEKDRINRSEAFVSKLESGIVVEGMDFVKNLEEAMTSQEEGVNEVIKEAMV
jgi:hypothetical protein